MQDLFRRVVNYMLDQYMTVLFVLAAVSGVTYLVLIYDIQNQEGNATLIKYSAEQGQIVEGTNLLLTQRAYSADGAAFGKINGKIISNLIRLDEIHSSLRQGERYIREGDRIIHSSGKLSYELRDIYFEGNKPLDTLMDHYIASVRSFQKLPAEQLALDNPELQKLLTVLSPELLDKLNKATSLIQKQGEFMLRVTINKQHLMFAISITTLVLMGIGLLNPLVLRLKESTIKVQQEKTFANNVVNTAQALIIGLDPEGKVILFNNHAREITGWDENEALGSDFFTRFIPAEDQEHLRSTFMAMMSGASEYSDEIETRMMIVTGDLINIIWHSTSTKASKTGLPDMFLATGLDITDRKKAEQDLQKAHADLARLSGRLQSEVNLAATLQQSILPAPKIELPGIQGHASLLTSSEVGGDYYDYYKVGGHYSILLIGDVSGHGVAAGTMVSAAKAGIYPLVHEGITNPGEILNSLNGTMLATAQQSLLMTMACLSLDARSGKLTFANAGHVLPYLWRHNRRQWEMLEASGLPLGKSVDSNYLVTAVELQMEVGDRLFLFTDGVVEEESPDGEAFGYDRLEAVLNHYGDAEPKLLQDAVMDALTSHCRGKSFSDDVTIVIVNHSDRVMQVNTGNEISDIIRISETFYRQGEHPLPRISKEYVVFLAEHGYADLLGRLSQDGICRVLPRHDDVCKKLGWNNLLNQHHESPDDDLFVLCPGQSVYRQFFLTHTEDKMFIMEEIQSWLKDQSVLPAEHQEALMVILDEMTENSLYAAPRDGKGNPYYKKGEERELSKNEEVRIDIALSPDLLGLMITDNWGTLTPGVFLRNISRAMEEGVIAGVGGAGLYMMWRLSDYLQIRVHPQQRTQVTAVWDINKNVDMNVDSGFQFIYHNDYEIAYQNRAQL